jgi:hypothetical protein
MDCNAEGRPHQTLSGVPGQWWPESVCVVCGHEWTAAPSQDKQEIH